jgi:acetyl-CoA C-acetyltransferase
MPTTLIVDAARTPLGKFLGGLSSLSAPSLAAMVLQRLAANLNSSAQQINEVLLGQVVTAGTGQAPARQAVLQAELSTQIPAATLNKVCGSGLYSVMTADRAIQAGAAKLILAGGMESMSRAPHLLIGSRTGWKYGKQTMLDSLEQDGLFCAHGQSTMGVYADAMAKAQSISRDDQDRWACQSHQRASQAITAGWYATEIVPCEVTVGKQTTSITSDEGPRADSTVAALARLKPAFGADGTATAGNSSPLSDGAAAVTVICEDLLTKIQPRWAFHIAAQAIHAGPPAELFTAPISACRAVVAKAGWQLADVEQWEINEAFASQTVACQRGLEIDPARLNAWGGAIALGHPIGASGARVLVTLIHRLLQLQQSRGIASLCLGGGEAVAVAIERVQ